MKRVILVAGGDMRQVYAARRLREKTSEIVRTWGLPAADGTASAEKIPTYDVLVLPILKNVETVPVLLGKPPTLAELAAHGKDGARVFGGNLGDAAEFPAPQFSVTDYLQSEEFALRNAVPTAEGAIQIAMERMARTLDGSAALIVGYGRIGTALALRLRGLGANVTVCAGRSDTRVLAQTQGCAAIATDALQTAATQADVIFNTVPALLWKEEILAKLSPNTPLIDLASKPGGVDFAAAKRLGLTAVQALGLPGKVAPVTAGEIVADTIWEILAERGVGDD